METSIDFRYSRDELWKSLLVDITPRNPMQNFKLLFHKWCFESSKYKSGILWKKYGIFKTEKSIIQSLVNEVKSEHEATKKLMEEKVAELADVELYMNNAQIYNEYFTIVEN